MLYSRDPARFFRHFIGRRAMRRVALLGGFHLSFSLIFILFFSRFFTESAAEARMLVVFHLLVSVTFWVLALSGCGLALQIGMIAQKRALKLLVLLIPALSFNFLALLFTADWITNQFWGINVTDRMAWEFVRRFADYQRTLLPAFGWGAMALLFSAGVLCYIRLAGQAVMDCGEILVRLFQFQRSFRWPVRSALLVILFAMIAGYGYAMVAFWQRSVTPLLLWRREPLTSFVILSRPYLIPGNVRSILFPPTPRRQMNAERDAQLRSSYPKQNGSGRNVIVMVVDCLRADHLSFYGYDRPTTPFLAGLHNEGRLRKVEEVRADCNCTPCGVLSTLAARETDDLGQGLFQIHDLLRDQGYRTHFILSGWHDVWYDLPELYGRSIDYYFEGTHSKNYLPDDDQLLLEGMENVQPFAGRPAFFYFHLMSAHDVGVYSPEYARWRPALEFSLGGSFSLTRRDPQMSVNTYDNKLLKTDAIIAELFAALDRKGYLRDSIVVILGDHGQALGEHDHYSHGKLLYEEDLRIPVMFIDEPGVQYRNLTAALQQDIAPTILERLGMSVPESWRGRSLLKSPAERAVTTHRGCQGGTAIIYREGQKIWKYIGGFADNREELYELRSDPREERDLADDRTLAPIMTRMRELVKQGQ
jgi:hypothetical protein